MRLGQKRMFYLDVARVIAIISITLNHAVNRSYQNYSGQMAEYLAIPMGSTLFKVLITVFSRIGVPLFLMITGVLIMNKKFEDAEDVKHFYKHNLLSLFITAEIWYFLMYWYLVLCSPNRPPLGEMDWLKNIDGLFKTMLFQDQKTMGSMWYMPMILCVYTTLPFIVMVKERLTGAKKRLLYLPVVLVFIIGMVMPAVNDFFSLLGWERLGSPLGEKYLTTFYYIYIIAGYWIGKGALSRLKTGTVALATAGSFLLCCGYQLWAYAQPANYLVGYHFPLLPVCAGFLFELLRRSADVVQKAQKPITYISRISFGIYFVHIVIMTTMVEMLDRYAPGLYLPVRLILLEIVSVGLSVAIIWPLSKIKLFKKYLFLIK